MFLPVVLLPETAVSLMETAPTPAPAAIRINSWPLLAPVVLITSMLVALAGSVKVWVWCVGVIVAAAVMAAPILVYCSLT